MKATGLGFDLPPRIFCVLPMDASPKTIAGRTWFLDWLQHDGHTICRAVEDRAVIMEVVVLIPKFLLS